MSDRPGAVRPPPPSAALAAARDAAVCCDLAPLAVLAIGGSDAASFLNGQISIDTRHFPAGACRHASFNSPKGRMLANFVLWRTDADPAGFRALLPADIAEAVRKRLGVYVLRSKVTLADDSAACARVGLGGPRAARTLQRAIGVAPAPFTTASAGDATALGLPGGRFVVLGPTSAIDAVRGALAADVVEGDYAVWQWLTLRAGVPVVTAATQDAFVAQTANWDALGGIDFQKGCYTGQEIIARMQYLGRLKERAHIFHADGAPAAAGTRLFNAAFGDQPCGTVVNAAPAPDGGSDLIAIVQLAALEHGDTRLGDPTGLALEPLPLPYEIAAPSAPRGRLR
jgi:hypothetical protein